MAERHNLKAEQPELIEELTAAAEAWRANIEERWRRECLPQVRSATSRPKR